jgi:hypothetical protein
VSTGQVRVKHLNSFFFPIVGMEVSDNYLRRIRSAYHCGASVELISEAYGIPLDVVQACLSEKNE